MPALRASIGELEVHRLAIEPDLALVGDDGAGDRLDQRRLAGAVVADDGQDFARTEIEIGMVEGDDAAVALDQAARVEDGLPCVAHAEIFLIHWSMATATMISTPTAKSCHCRSRPDEREAVAEDADDQRAEQRAEDRAAAAEERGAADHHGGDRVEVGGRPACGLTPPMRPISTQPAKAQMKPASA